MAKRIALGAQGFARKRSTQVDTRQFRRVMGDLGLIQLDSVNVCVRSHYMPFYSRLGAYEQDALDLWLNQSGNHFEYWAHEASVLPVEKFPLWRWKMSSHKRRKSTEEVMKKHPQLAAEVVRQIAEVGPMTVRDVDAPSSVGKGPWWGNGPGKLALEMLFAEGRLCALRGNHFMRSYDTPERLIPADILLNTSYNKEEAHRQLLLDALSHHGIGTEHDIADYYRLKLPISKPILSELAAEGLIERVEVPGWKGPVYMALEASCPRAICGSALLSPFDPVTWFRQRAERIFDFHYRIEIYTPQDKRVYGYYVLPFLLDGELVGRVDLKADRKISRLLVRSAFVEEGQEPERVAKALAAELERFAAWLGLGSLHLERKGNLMSKLRAAL